MSRAALGRQRHLDADILPLFRRGLQLDPIDQTQIHNVDGDLRVIALLQRAQNFFFGHHCHTLLTYNASILQFIAYCGKACMTAEGRQKIQIILAAGIAIAALRTGYILYERHENNAAPVKQEAPPLKADYYVTPKKLHPQDLKTARQLTQQPVWVRQGYRFTYYPYDHRTDFKHEAGLLGPIEKLEIKDVVTDVTPHTPDQRQVMAVFEKDGKKFAFPIGRVKGEDYRIYSDDMLFIQDPRELYKHWPADVWDSISKHEVKAGMNELQTSFAIGVGAPVGNGPIGDRTLNYANGGKPLLVTFAGDKATDIRPGG